MVPLRRIVLFIANFPAINNHISWRRKFLLFLQGAYLYHPLRERMKSKLGERRWSTTTNWNSPTRALGRTRRRRETQIEHSTAAAATEIGMLPEMDSFSRKYHIVSTVVTILQLIQLLLALMLESADSCASCQVWGTLLRCHSPRLIASHLLDEKFIRDFSILLCLAHLLWRSMMTLANNRFEFNVLPFLLAKQEILEERIRWGARRINRQLELGGHLDMLDQSLFYRIEDRATGRARYKLRPNRTVQTRRAIIEKIHFAFNSSIPSILIMTLITVPSGFYSGIFRLKMIYSNCLIDEADISAQLFRRAGSVLISLLVLADACLAVFFATSAGYMLALDLIIYWRHVESKMDSIYARLLKTERLEQQQQQAPDTAAGSNYVEPFVARCPRLSFFDGPRQMALRALPQQPQQREPIGGASTSRAAERKLDRDIVELQYTMVDFFLELNRVDNYISQLIPFCLGVWLSTNTIVTLRGLQLSTGTNHDLIVVRSFQVLGISVAICVCTLILGLKKRTEPACAKLFSLLALDKGSNKLLWVQLLEVYTIKPRYAFTLMRGKIFTQVTLIQIISYTLTVIGVIEQTKRDQAARSSPLGQPSAAG